MQDFAKLPSSCLEVLKNAAGKKLRSGNYWIRTPDGIASKVYCDMEVDGGGWTTIVEVDKEVHGRIAELKIEDMELKYKQILWMSCSQHKMDYEYKTSTDFVSGGYNPFLNYLNIGGRRYRVRPANDRWSKLPGNAFIKRKYFKAIDPKPETCNHEGAASDICASRFIFDVPKNKRITGLGDIESATGETVENNFYAYHFRVLVR